MGYLETMARRIAINRSSGLKFREGAAEVPVLAELKPLGVGLGDGLADVGCGGG